MKVVKQIQARAFDTAGAAVYISKSPSFLNNTRLSDKDRLANGEPPKGPKWVMQGRNIRYYREDLDAWLDSFKDQSNPAWDYDFQSDTTHLKNQTA